MEIKTISKDQSLRKAMAGSGKKKISKVLKIIILIIIILVAAFLILWQTGYLKALKLAFQIQKQQQLSAEDKKVIEQLGTILLLPEGTPTMAVVKDVETLKKSQPVFFANAKNGDRLIIYPEQAIIFDALANKIIKVGPVQVTGNQNTQPQVEPVNFAIYNSLRSDPTNAKTTEMETRIKTAFNNAVVAIKADSTKADYAKTLVIDLVGNNQEMDKIAQAIGGQISELPTWEKKPEGVAVLVIIGKQ